MNPLIDTIRSLGPLRLAMMVVVAAGSLAFFIFLTSRLATPELSSLYGELDGQDSGQIVAQLDQMGITYKVSADGRRILVPADQVGRLRVLMAEQGLPSGGSIGYEIFDRSDGLGTTSFVQKINHLRALEGELARTIGSITQIQHARVHLVLPKRELFSREQTEPSASIILTLRGNRGLTREQILSIQHLVAAAVQGLQPNQISIIDSSGALLARGGTDDEIGGFAASSEEMRRSYENRLAHTIETLLERSVGAGNVRAEVSAEMDFDRITESAEIFDPDGQVVRSTQTVEETSDSQDGQVARPVTIGNNLPDNLPQLGEGDASVNRTSRIEETVNYEISRTTKTHVRETGQVKRLSVAVLINGIVGTDDDGQDTYQPRLPEELEQLAALVRSTVGYNEARGDTLEIVNLRFADLQQAAASAPGSGFGFLGLGQAELLRIAEILVLGIIAVLALLFVIKPLFSRVLEGNFAIGALSESAGLLPDPTGARPALSGPAAALPGVASATAIAGPVVDPQAGPTVADEIDSMIDLNKVEGRVRASSVKKIGEIVEKHPDEAVAILRSWLYQDG
ncbi:MAG: flagellar basal-body MS-ring/collar protein FliF [Kiloniellales bacterium]